MPWPRVARLRGLLGLAVLCGRGAAGLARTGAGRLDFENVAAGAAGQTLSGLQIGSFEGGADAVANGVVQPGWLPSQPTEVGPSDTRTRLWTLVAIPGAPAAPLAELSVLSADSSVATARIQRVDGAGAVRGGDVVGGVLEPLVADVVYECHRTGTAPMIVVYRFADARLAPVQLGIAKECAARPRRGLCLGTAADRLDDAVRDGSSRWTAATATQRLLPVSADHVDLQWALRPTGGAEDAAVQLIAPPRAVVTPIAAGGIPAAGPPLAELRRWRRLLLLQAGAEAKHRDQGRWGLPAAAGNEGMAGAAAPLVHVSFTGALAAGGELQTAAEDLPEGVSRPALGVQLECLREGTALVQVEVAPYPPYQPYRPVVLSLVKQCGGIVSGGFDASTQVITPEASPDLVRDGAAVGNLPDVSNLQETAAIYWRDSGGLGAPSASRVVCNSSIVDATLSSALVAASHGGGVPVGRQDLHFRCSGQGVALCTLRFAWRLFEGPEVQFKKICGGVRDDVDIESDLPDVPLVLLAGQAQRSWWDTEGGPQVTLPAEDDKATFTVSLDRELKPDERALEISPPTIRVFRPDVVKAYIMGDMVQGATVASSSDSVDLQVKMECLSTGDSRIEVALPIGTGSSFKPVNFAFDKRCIIVAYWQQWWFLVVFGFLAVFFLSCTIMLGCVCRFQQQLKGDLKKGMQAAPGAGARELAAKGESSDEE